MDGQRDVIEAALCQDIVTHVIEMQIMNLTQLRGREIPANDAVRRVLTSFALEAASACHRGEIPKPVLATIQNRVFANQIERSLKKNGIDDLIAAAHAKVRAADPGTRLDQDVKSHSYSYFKIAVYVSQVSWMIRHGLDPNILSMSKEAMERCFAKLRAIAREAGVPVMVGKIPSRIRPAPKRTKARRRPCN